MRRYHLFLLVGMGFLSLNIYAQNPSNHRNSFLQAATEQAAKQHHFTAESPALKTKTAPKSLSQLQSATSTGPCADTLLFEDFESQVIPPLWSNIDNDGLSVLNSFPSNWFITRDFENRSFYFCEYDTNYVAATSSNFNILGTSDNWLILPAVTICDTNIFLQWKSAPLTGLARMDGYEVLLSTTGNLPIDFNTQLEQFSEDISVGAGVPGPGTVHGNFLTGHGVLQQWSSNLSAYAGQTIYVAFHHNSTNDDLLLLDDIFVGRPIANDVLVVESYQDHEYPITPLAHVQTMTYSGWIANFGRTPLSNPSLTVNCDRNGNPVYTGTASIPSQGVGMGNVLTVNPSYLPVDTGTHRLIYEASSSNPDLNLTNNFDTLTFWLTDSVYSRDNNRVCSNLSVGIGVEGIMGQEYDIMVNSELSSITFRLQQPIVGDSVYAVVYNMGPFSPSTEIARTDTMLVPSGAESFYTLPFSSPVYLSPGTYMIGIHEMAPYDLTLAYSFGNFAPGRTWAYFNGNWSNSEDYNFFPSYFLRANVHPSCLAPETDFSQNSSMLTTNFTDASTYTPTSYFWDFGDGNTSTLANPSHTYTAPGSYNVCLTSSNSCGSDSVCHLVLVTCATPSAAFSFLQNGNLNYDFTDASAASSGAAYAWDFGDAQSSTLQNPSHTYAMGGNYTVCLTVTDMCGSDSSCSSLLVVGLENDLDAGISIYPNPGKTHFSVDIQLDYSDDIRLTLVNAIGQVLLTKELKQVTHQKIDFSLDGISAGLYFLHVSSSKGNIVRPVEVLD